MKSHLENIGETASDSSLLHGSGPFGAILEDPFDKTLGEFGKGGKDLDSLRQNKENFKEEYVLELVRKKINEIEVDLENPVVAVDKIIEYLEERGIKISEDIKKYTEFAISEKMNFLRDLKRLGINKDNPNKKEKESLREMALKDAEWIGDVVKYIRENRDNTKEIEKFWKEFDKTFLSFKEHEKNKDFIKKYSIEQGPEVIKRGVLAEIAAMDLLEELANSFEGCKKVKIEYPTAKQDVNYKVDFFLVVTIRTKKINTTKKIPVQVKSCDISNFANHNSSEKWLKEKVKFVLDNMINTNETKEIAINPECKYQTRARRRISEFFNVKENINRGGIFIILPNGTDEDMNSESFNPQDKSRKKMENCINEKGVPSEALRDHFLFESQTIKNVEASLVQ